MDRQSCYGNRDIGGGIDRFWLTGKLCISAVEQIGFLRRLAAGTLPSTLESAPNYVVHGKTGWAKRPDRVDLGCHVGWVERAGRRWFFALNIDMPQPADAAMREPIVRAVLKRAGALP